MKPVLYMEWVKCPNCGQRLFMKDNTAKAHGIYIKCKSCKKQIKITIE